MDDVESAWTWVASTSRGHRWSAAKIVLLGGSAGGLLAAALALRVRDKALMTIDGLMLLQPMLDDRNSLPSTFDVHGGGLWDRQSNVLAWQLYLGGLAERTYDIAPARCSNLEGLPGMFIEAAQSDVLRDEALAFAASASRSGVPVELHMWPGAVHGFEGSVDTRNSNLAWSARIAFLADVFG